MIYFIFWGQIFKKINKNNKEGKLQLAVIIPKIVAFTRRQA